MYVSFFRKWWLHSKATFLAEPNKMNSETRNLFVPGLQNIFRQLSRRCDVLNCHVYVASNDVAVWRLEKIS